MRRCHVDRFNGHDVLCDAGLCDEERCRLDRASRRTRRRKRRVQKKRFFSTHHGPKNRSRAHFGGPVFGAKKWPPMGGRKSAQRLRGDPNSGRHSEAAKCDAGPPRNRSPKARAMWQWANFLEAQLGTRKTLVYLNFDESSCRLWTRPRRGLLSAKTCLRMRRGRAPQQTATLSTRRTAFSLLAFLADNVDVQKSLPQLLVLNAHTVTLADARWLEHETKDLNIVVQRRKSAWIKSGDLAVVLREVGRALRPFRDTHAFVLALDVCPTHWTTCVARAAAESNLGIVFVPPSTTAFLQPLDVHVYNHLKRAARHGLEDLYIRDTVGHVANRDIIRMWAHAVCDVLNSRCWRFAFASCGFGHNQANIGERCRYRCGLAEPPHVGCDLPTLSMLQLCTSMRVQLPLGWWSHLPLRAQEHASSAAVFSVPVPHERSRVGFESAVAGAAPGAHSLPPSHSCPTAETPPATTSARVIPRARLLFPARRPR